MLIPYNDHRNFYFLESPGEEIRGNNQLKNRDWIFGAGFSWLRVVPDSFFTVINLWFHKSGKYLDHLSYNQLLTATLLHGLDNFIQRFIRQSILDSYMLRSLQLLRFNGKLETYVFFVYIFSNLRWSAFKLLPL